MAEPNNNRNNNGDWWKILAGVTAGIGLIGGVAYLATRKQEEEEQTATSSSASRNSCSRSFLHNNMSELANALTEPRHQGGIARTSVPVNPVITSTNSLLSDIYVRYIALKQDEFYHHYTVFGAVFVEMQRIMKEIDPYYNKYSSRKQFAGSHFDGLRIKKPDEFDMDIVIGLPVNFKLDPFNPGESDIVIENATPAYVRLKMGQQYNRLPFRDGADWLTNKTAYTWLDSDSYLLHYKFRNWFKSLMDRALLKLELSPNGSRVVHVEGRPYSVRLYDSGPAVTMKIENYSIGFAMDIDFVPALKFPEARWKLPGYRNIPRGCNKEDFMLVPKPNKAETNEIYRSRSWRLALHDQEKKMLYDSNNLKTTIKLIKKLRDVKNMKGIASYYIKTIFLWEIEARKDPQFWNNNPKTLFLIMLPKFRDAMKSNRIPYFWNDQHNLIGHINSSTLTYYENILNQVLVDATADDYKRLASHLLTPEEYANYKKYLS